MAKTLLTDIVARTAKPIAGTQFTIWDTSLRGFGLRVGCHAKTWTVMLDSRRRRRVVIGRYPAMGLQAARAEARRVMLSAALNRHQTAVPPTPFTTALEKFLDLHLSQTRASNAKEKERIMRKHFLPMWRNRLMTEIVREDVTRILDAMMDTPIMANNTFATVRTFFRWSLRRGYLASSPCEAMLAPAKRVSRERVLSVAELARVLSTARSPEQVGAFSTIVMLLILTAQRRGEIANLRSEWIDRSSGTITLPRHITKNGYEHVVPVTPYVLELLPSAEGLLFPARGSPNRSYNGWSKGMHGFRTSCRIDDFNLHDLRRTAATMMAQLGTPPHIIERILNHVTGSTAHSITTLGRIYNRHLYLDEMREALCRWESHVLKLLAT